MDFRAVIDGGKVSWSAVDVWLNAVPARPTAETTDAVCRKCRRDSIKPPKDAIIATLRSRRVRPELSFRARPSVMHCDLLVACAYDVRLRFAVREFRTC